MLTDSLLKVLIYSNYWAQLLFFEHVGSFLNLYGDIYITADDALEETTAA